MPQISNNSGVLRKAEVADERRVPRANRSQLACNNRLTINKMFVEKSSK